MAFRVEPSPEAFSDLDGISSYIETRTRFAVAERWFNGIFAAIRALAELPHRCPKNPPDSKPKFASFSMESGTADTRYTFGIGL